jgi:5'-3' exonuclease
MQVHLIDGTYELFRYHFAPGGGHVTAAGQEVGATRGVLRSMLSMVRNEGVTHIAVATDSVIESWRNDLYEGYKNGEGVPEELLSQFPLIEQGLALAGFQVWPMIEYEADDGMAAGAAMAVADTRVERVFICTPDKDLAQCVTSDGRVVQFDRRQEILRDEAGVIEKWGVKPASIPDYLALVGDTADGFPGLKGWGAKSAATLLYRYDHLENIPADSADWDVKVRSAAKLGETLVENVEDAFLFRRIATVDTEGPVIGDVDSLLYEGPKPGWEEFCERIDGQSLLRK